MLERPWLPKAHLRVARPSDDLTAVTTFYRDGLGFEVIGNFTDHEGFSGVMLGHRELGYHLEFTQKSGHSAGRAPTEDNLLVFYLPIVGEWKHAVARLEQQGSLPVPAFNPYWDRHGVTFEDPDGYRVVLQNAAWPMSPEIGGAAGDRYATERVASARDRTVGGIACISCGYPLRGLRGTGNCPECGAPIEATTLQGMLDADPSSDDSILAATLRRRSMVVAMTVLCVIVLLVVLVLTI